MGHVAGRSGRRAAVLLASMAVAVGTLPLYTPASATTTASASDVLPYQDPSLSTSQRVSDLLGRMDLDEKIGQMTQAERGGIDSDTTKITSDRLGSVLSGGGSVPAPNAPTAWADMVDRYQAA